MIRFVDVTMRYHQHVALDQVNLDIDDGEMVFLTGHSGAGKSTLLKLILSIEQASHGQIFVQKQNLYRLSRRKIAFLRRDMGINFQDPHLISTRTIFENVGLPLLLCGYRMSDIRRRVHAALDKVGLLNKVNRYPVELSLGEQQRVGIARSVVNKPSLLIADEPTGNLDPQLSLDIMRLFEAFNQVGVTVLIATHDLSVIARFPYRIITLNNGVLTTEKDAHEYA